MGKLRNLQIILANKLSFLFSDRIYLKLQFRLRMGYCLNLDEPKTLSEKIQWLKLHDHNPIYPNLVDKYEVKPLVAKKIGDKYIIKTLCIWDNLEDVDFNYLPQQFVLKTTHGGGNSGVIICKNKETLNKEEIIKKLKKSIKQDIFNDFREWPYKK